MKCIAKAKVLCYNTSMKHEIYIPADVEQRLSERALEMGQDVVHLIQIAVVQFVDHNVHGQQSSRGIMPDLLVDSPEISAPIDLPMSGKRRGIGVTVESRSNLRPDPVSPAE